MLGRAPSANALPQCIHTNRQASSQTPAAPLNPNLNLNLNPNRPTSAAGWEGVRVRLGLRLGLRLRGESGCTWSDRGTRGERGAFIRRERYIGGTAQAITVPVAPMERRRAVCPACVRPHVRSPATSFPGDQTPSARTGRRVVGPTFARHFIAARAAPASLRAPGGLAPSWTGACRGAGRHRNENFRR